MLDQIQARDWYAPSRRTFFTLIKIAAIAVAVLVCGTLDAPAQEGRFEPYPPFIDDCRSGEIAIDAASKRTPVISLGLAAGAVSIVEFPAADAVRFVHQGNAKFAAVFDSPTKSTDRSVTIVPGEDFASKPFTRAAITIQMRSGLVFVLEYTVTGIRENSHRCVLRYDVEKAVDARRSLGLSTGAVPAKPSEIAPKQKTDDVEPAARAAAESCLRGFEPCVAAWSPAVAGLEIGVSKPFELTGDRQFVVVAVRNSSGTAIRLAPGFPALRLMTLGAKGRAVESSPVKPARLVPLMPDGTVDARAAKFFAIVFDAPVTGVSQRLFAIAATRDAADAPATVAIPKIQE